MNTQMYDAQAATVNVEDIAIDENNRLILSNIRSNREGIMKLGGGNEQLWIRDEVEDHTDYRPEGAHDIPTNFLTLTICQGTLASTHKP